MADITRFSGSDGRRVEKRTVENVNDSGAKERIVETHVEQVPFQLEERVTEKIVPIITERRKEKFEGGKLVKTDIEQVEDTSLHMNPVTDAVLTRADVEDVMRKLMAEKPEQKKLKLRSEPVASRNWLEYVDYIFYVAISGQLAFIVYQLFLKGMLGK